MIVTHCRDVTHNAEIKQLRVHIGILANNLKAQRQRTSTKHQTNALLNIDRSCTERQHKLNQYCKCRQQGNNTTLTSFNTIRVRHRQTYKIVLSLKLSTQNIYV